MRLSGKNYCLLMGLALLLLLALIAGPAAPSARAAEADVAMYYDALSPYGTWVDYGNYGPVWYPTQGVTPNWRPYVDGRWVPTDDGWVFETGEPWGWATYHFGNWMPTTEYGWVWDPGSTWYPSTAAWRTSDDYVGWAPIPPPDYVPEPAYYPTGGYDPSLAPMDLLSPPYWTFAQADNFLLGFDQPYQPAYSYYNTGYLAPYDYAPYVFANSLLLSDFYYPGFNHNAFYCYGPSFPFVSRVTNINIVNINNFARNHNFNHIRNGLPSQAVFNRHPFIRDAIPASVLEGGRLHAQRVSNPATVGRQLARPGVVKPPANVPKLSKEIPKGGAPQAGPAVRGGARGVPVAPRGATSPRAVTTPKGEAAPRGVTTPKGEAAHGGVTTPRGEAAPSRGVTAPRAPREAPTHAVTPPTREPRAPVRAPTGKFTAPGREFRATSRGTTMPPPSTHAVTPRMQQQIRQYQAPSRPAPSFRPSAPAPAPHMAPSAPAPRPSAPAPAPRPSAPAPAPHPSAPAPSGGGGGHPR